MRKRLLLTTLATLMAVITTFAVPAKPGLKKKVTLKNGSTVELTLKGDEHFSFYRNADGKACQLKDGELTMLTDEEVSKQWSDMREKRLAVDNTVSRRARRVGEAGTTTGTQHGLVILLQYQDVKFQNDSATTNNAYKRYFNEEGYNEGGNAGSVRDYFKDQSYGKLTIDFDVVGPYTVANEMAYYGAHYTDDSGTEHNDTHPALMVREGVDAAHKDGVNFTKYDWDNDGVVDQVFVIYAGYAEAQGAAKETIWPHEWVLAAEDVSVKYDGVRINTYGCTAELRGSEGTTMDGIGTACHEFTHCLGLPDMYDTQGDNYGMAYWDVMCAGSYNDDSCTPAGYTSYERWFSGWMEPTELKEMTTISNMPPLEKEPVAYILYNEKNKNEYYLLENRQPVKYDKGLFGHGMLVVHVDYSSSAWNSNTVNTTKGHERMTIIAADNEYSEQRYWDSQKQIIYSPSMAGDPWPGTSGNTMLGNYTTPAATLYNANKDGQKLMSKAIDNITEDVEAMTVSFVACRPEMDVPQTEGATEQAEGNSVTISWPAVSGAVSYDIELIAKDKAASTPEDAFIRAYDFAKFESKTTGYSDISSKLADYGLSNWTGSKLYTTPNKLRFGTSTTTGTLKTPWWYTPASTNATLVMGVDVVRSGTTVDGTINVSNADVNENNNIRNATDLDPVSFEVTGNQKLVIHLKDILKAAYQFQIAPSSQMYLNYLAIYDGIWTAEQLGISNTPAQASRRAVTTSSYTSTTNSYTFTDLSDKKTYSYRLRAKGEAGNYSAWSEEKALQYGTTGIQGILSEPADNAPVRYFDMQGREVSGKTKGLLIRKQGNSVKKVIIR